MLARSEVEIKQRILEIRREQFRIQARSNLLDFTRYTKPDYQAWWHHEHMCAELDAFVEGDTRFLMIFAPPRHGKSELVSRRLPAYIHGRYPNAEIFAASYLDSLAGDMTKDVQSIIDSPSYRELFPKTQIPPPGQSYVKGIRNTAEHTVLTADGVPYPKGKYRGQGIGGSFTGKGMNFGIIDDPIKGREIADSPAFRDRLWEFFKSDFMNRMETDLVTGRTGQILITLTRWHEDDLVARLLELSKRDSNAIRWRVVEYPAERKDLDSEWDPRPMHGALWPAKYPTEELAKFKSDPRAWGSLFQQSPRPADGIIFKANMFRYGPMPAKFDYTFVTADTAYKDSQENDFTVFTAFGMAAGQMYIPAVWRAQIRAADVEAPAVSFIKPWQKYGFRGCYIEPKGHGIYLNQKLPRHGVMIPSDTQLKEFYADRTKDKVARANNAVPWLVGRQIIINEEIPNREELVEECLIFNKGKHDDFVDTVVDGVKFAFGKPLSILDVL